VTPNEPGEAIIVIKPLAGSARPKRRWAKSAAETKRVREALDAMRAFVPRVWCTAKDLDDIFAEAMRAPAKRTLAKRIL
jgi:hypothetical protein